MTEWADEVTNVSAGLLDITVNCVELEAYVVCLDLTTMQLAERRARVQRPAATTIVAGGVRRLRGDRRDASNGARSGTR